MGTQQKPSSTNRLSVQTTLLEFFSKSASRHTVFCEDDDDIIEIPPAGDPSIKKCLTNSTPKSKQNSRHAKAASRKKGLAGSKAKDEKTKQLNENGMKKFMECLSDTGNPSCSRMSTTPLTPSKMTTGIVTSTSTKKHFQLSSDSRIEVNSHSESCEQMYSPVFVSASEVTGSTAKPLNKISLAVLDSLESNSQPFEFDPLSMKPDSNISALPTDDSDETLGISSDEDIFSPRKQPVIAQKAPVDCSDLSCDLDEFLVDLETSFKQSEPNAESVTSPLVPYYLANVRHAMGDVLSHEFNVCYFNEDDVASITKFQNTSDKAQMLYVRLLFRQHAWIPVHSMKYIEISADLKPHLDELAKSSLIRDNSSETSLQEVLAMLPAPRLRQLSKEMKVAESSKTKLDMAKELILHVRSSNLSSMFKTAQSAEGRLLKRARALLPECYKLTNEPRAVLLRIMTLFSLVFENSQDKEKTRQAFMYTMLMETIGKIKYPEVPLNCQTPIFSKRTDVIRLVTAQTLEYQIDACLQKRKFADGFSVYQEARCLYDEWNQDTDMLNYDKGLPGHLLRYTCMNQLIRVLGYGCEVLQKLKKYSEAAELYGLMLAQTTYGRSKRGFWWERLTLIHDFHLRNKHKALELIAKAFADPFLRVGPKLALVQRAEKLCKSEKVQLQGLNTPCDPICDPPTTEIEAATVGRSIPDSTRKHVFVQEGSSGLVPSSVESVAMKHYMDSYQLIYGLHAESSVFTTIFGLLFWDIIFMPGIPDTFYSPYQYQPLDMQTDSFFISRQEPLQSRLEIIRHESVEVLGELIADVWQAHFGECTVCISWDLFESPAQIKGLMACFGNQLLAAICERFCKGYRHCRSGLPDLTMWNPDTHCYKIVEVKGPGDKLSTKQILWIDYINRNGGQAEVCHVKAASRQIQSRKRKLYT